MSTSRLDDCPLPPATQWRNLLIFAAITGLYYFAAPVLYVGITHSSLLSRLGYDDEIANMPASLYLFLAPVPVFVAWALPQVRLLRWMEFVSLGLIAAICGVMALALKTNEMAALVPVFGGAEGILMTAASGFGGVAPGMCGILPLAADDSRETILWICYAHGAVLGAANGVSMTLLWELLGRGTSISRRGTAMGFAFGAGPVLAFAGSLASQWILKGDALGIELPEAWKLSYPANFRLLFAAAVPIMLLGASLSWAFVIPLPQQELKRQPFVESMFGGLAEFLSYRTLLFGALAYVAVYASGTGIFQNISLYTRDALRRPSEEFVGLQNSLRFGCKALAGVCLGVLLSRTNPKAPLIATTLLLFLGVWWAVIASGWAYLFAFAILGCGELMGCYFPNYVACASAKSRVRRNMAFLSLMSAAVGVAPLAYGSISKYFDLKTSFQWALVAIYLSLVFVIVALPTHPKPRESDMDESDK